jgi:alpha-L-arabinofuranosidase
MWRAALLLTCLAVSGVAADPLVNASFEDAPVGRGWERNVYGAQPEFASDSGIFHAGKSSLRIFSTAASDTALAQEVTLVARQWYRFSAWVRTESLDPHGAPVSATIQVQRPHGAGSLASAPNQRDTKEWTNVVTWFQAPEDGRVRLCLFYVGFGRGTGTVWFDDVRLESVDANAAPILIRREPLRNARINPMQYGQFVEYLCDLVPSMWTEKLYDGSFEGLSPYKFAFIKQTDFKEKPWYPSGAVNRGKYILDSKTKISGEVSQQIEVQGGEPCTLGISQDGIFVDSGKGYDFSCWLRAVDVREPVEIKLQGKEKAYAKASFRPGTNWQKFKVRLHSSHRDVDATFSIQFRGPGTLWIDNASLMPVETVGGWRPDVVDAVRALRPRIIRFGGSALDEPGFGDFQWSDTVGDPDHRRPFRAWGGLQPTGPGLEEFVQFCHAVDAEPMICVRFSGRKPSDAADQVEYFNGSPTTRMGSVRAKNGHREPYRIHYWQVGNERQSAEYDSGLAEFCRAMKAVDPSIVLLSSFPTANSVRKAGEYLGYVAPHHYTPNLAYCEVDLANIRQLLEANAPGRGIKVAVTEWNTTAGDWGLGRATLMTLGNALACSRYHNLLHRNSDLVEIANRSNLINSFGSGIIQVDNHRLYKTATYHAQWLYANLAGDRPLRIDSEMPASVGVDLSATWNDKSGEVTLFAVNASSETIHRNVDVSAFGTKPRTIQVWKLADRDRAGETDVRNDFADPERISIQRSSLRAVRPNFVFEFPALSMTVLRFASR